MCASMCVCVGMRIQPHLHLCMDAWRHKCAHLSRLRAHMFAGNCMKYSFAPDTRQQPRDAGTAGKAPRLSVTGLTPLRYQRSPWVSTTAVPQGGVAEDGGPTPSSPLPAQEDGNLLIPPGEVRYSCRCKRPSKILP